METDFAGSDISSIYLRIDGELVTLDKVNIVFDDPDTTPYPDYGTPFDIDKFACGYGVIETQEQYDMLNDGDLYALPSHPDWLILMFKGYDGESDVLFGRYYIGAPSIDKPTYTGGLPSMTDTPPALDIGEIFNGDVTRVFLTAADAKLFKIPSDLGEVDWFLTSIPTLSKNAVITEDSDWDMYRDAPFVVQITLSLDPNSLGGYVRFGRLTKVNDAPQSPLTMQWSEWVPELGGFDGE